MSEPSAPPPGASPAVPLRERARRLLELVDDLLHVAVALTLVVLAAVDFAHILVDDLSGLGHALHGRVAEVPEAVLAGVNDLLFVVILLEILRTVTAHLKEHAFALRPFLIIGVISAVRHLLIVGARMSVGEGGTGAEEAVLFHQHALELALNGALVLVLVLAYWLVARIRE